MSGLQTGLVWSVAGLTRTQREVLLALADHAEHDGYGARPGVALLAWKTDLTPRTVQATLRELEGLGIIEVVREGGGRGRKTDYRLHLERVKHKTPFVRPERVKSDAERVKPTRARATEPSLKNEPSVGDEGKPRRRDVVWEALSEVFGEPTTPTEKSHRGKTAREVRAAVLVGLPLHAPPIDKTDPDAFREAVVRELRRRMGALRGTWGPTVDVTEDALVKHWTRAGQLAAGASSAYPSLGDEVL